MNPLIFIQVPFKDSNQQHLSFIAVNTQPSYKKFHGTKQRERCISTIHTRFQWYFISLHFNNQKKKNYFPVSLSIVNTPFYRNNKNNKTSKKIFHSTRSSWGIILHFISKNPGITTETLFFSVLYILIKCSRLLEWLEVENNKIQKISSTLSER